MVDKGEKSRPIHRAPVEQLQARLARRYLLEAQVETTLRFMTLQAAVAAVRAAHWATVLLVVPQQDMNMVVREEEAMVVVVLRLVVLPTALTMEEMVVLAAMEQQAEQEGQPRLQYLAMD